MKVNIKIMILLLIFLFVTLLYFIFKIDTLQIVDINTEEKNLEPINVSTLDNNNYTISESTSVEKILNILENANYENEPCDGIADYIIETTDGKVYCLLSDCCGILKNNKEAHVSQDDINLIIQIINENI